MERETKVLHDIHWNFTELPNMHAHVVFHMKRAEIYAKLGPHWVLLKVFLYRGGGGHISFIFVELLYEEEQKFLKELEKLLEEEWWLNKHLNTNEFHVLTGQ